MSKFIGRQVELNKLREISKKKSASFIVVRGRRRIGKSRLIEEFGKSFDHYYSFAGLAPEKGITAKNQLEEFSRQIAQQFKAPFARYDDWSDALWAVGERIKTGPVLLLFDEISWMGLDAPAFLGKIKNFWDYHLKQNAQLVFVVCGSASAWIENNILSSTGFVGRISYTLTLDELPLLACKQFWPKNISAYEKLKVLAVTGGIPKYLEEINPNNSAEENIKQLCFSKGAILVDEFRQLFSDLFLRDSAFYKKIVEVLITGPKERNEICDLLNIDPGGRMSDYLAELELSGFITRDFTWDIKSGLDSKLSKYRLSDNYVRFYLKYIDKNLSKIDRNSFQTKSLTALPEWNTIMGLQFENLVLNNRSLIHQELQITPNEIVSENPFYQRKTARYQGCQIDYLIQTKFNTLYICEIKFSKNLVDSSVIDEVQKKIDALKYAKGYSCRPVLIHVNGVTDDVVDSDFFASIIDFSNGLEDNS
ncbi:MAG TPA: ATPase [Legionellales bacterium]|nr:ATPase [Legionellales bacterium]